MRLATVLLESQEGAALMEPGGSILSALARLHTRALAALLCTDDTTWDRQQRRVAQALCESLWTAAPLISDYEAWPTHQRLLQRPDSSWLAAHCLPALASTLGGLVYLERHAGAAGVAMVVGHVADQALAHLEALMSEEEGARHVEEAQHSAFSCPVPLPTLARLLQHMASGAAPSTAVALGPLLARLRKFVFVEAPLRYGVRLAEHLSSSPATHPPAWRAHLSLLLLLLRPLAAAAGAGARKGDEALDGVLAEVRVVWWLCVHARAACVGAR